MMLTPLRKLPKNVRDLGKLIVVKGIKKSNKSPNLVTLVRAQVLSSSFVILFDEAVREKEKERE